MGIYDRCLPAFIALILITGCTARDTKESAGILLFAAAVGPKLAVDSVATTINRAFPSNPTPLQSGNHPLTGSLLTSWIAQKGVVDMVWTTDSEITVYTRDYLELWNIAGVPTLETRDPLVRDNLVEKQSVRSDPETVVKISKIIATINNPFRSRYRISKDNRFICISTWENSVVLVDLGTDVREQFTTGIDYQFEACAFSPDSTKIAVAAGQLFDPSPVAVYALNNR